MYRSREDWEWKLTSNQEKKPLMDFAVVGAEMFLQMGKTCMIFHLIFTLYIQIASLKVIFQKSLTISHSDIDPPTGLL